MKHWKYNTITAGLLIMLTGLLAGCVSDDTDGCEGSVYLQFGYTHNLSQTDLLTEQVEYINLFFYDEQEKLAQTKKVAVTELDPDGGITLYISPGGYTVVAWGNNHDDKFEVRDHSTLSSLRLSLVEDEDGYVSDTPGLFYGKTSMSISAMNQADSRISLIKDTNHIRVIIDNVTPATRVAAEAIPGTDLKVRIIGCNWLYDHANNLDPASRSYKMEYRPANSINGENKPQAEFDILRMFADNSCQLEFMIEDVRYPDNGPIQRNWLTQTIIETIPEVNNDDDLNRYDDFEIRVEVELVNNTWVVIRMLINDWEVKTSQGGI